MLNLYLKVIRLRNWSEDFSGQPPFVFFGEQRNRSWGIPGHPVRHCCSWRRSNALSFAHGQQTAVTNHICCVFVLPHIYHFFTFFFINVLFIQLEILHDGKKLRTPQKNITVIHAMIVITSLIGLSKVFVQKIWTWWCISFTLFFSSGNSQTPMLPFWHQCQKAISQRRYVSGRVWCTQKMLKPEENATLMPKSR